MSQRVHFYGFNGTVGSYRTYGSMIEQFAADAMPIGWEWGDDAVYYREYIAQQDRYSLEEWNHKTEEDCVEVLCRDGEPIGVLDQPISRDDLFADYETIEAMHLREGREDAERELMDDVRRENRDAAE